MFEKDISLLCCPVTHEDLELEVVTRDADGEIIEGKLVSSKSRLSYDIINGIPRFVSDKNYNKTWDYKWTQIDAGKGLNYLQVDKSSSQYTGHNIYNLNDHGGNAYLHMAGRIALDLGCGIGQYSYRALEDYNPAKIVAVDLTGGVDVFRKIMLERFPHYKATALLVQASVFELPFRDETFDYVFSLGVLHHTGNTREAIRNGARVTKYGGQVNFWVYSTESIALNSREPGRKEKKTLAMWLWLFLRYFGIKIWMSAFRKMSHNRAVDIVKFFSSNFWYMICRIPLLGIPARLFFNSGKNPDFYVRFVNNYDGYINAWDETWDEAELFPTLRQAQIAILGISEWRLGFWGVKLKNFYP